MPLSISIILPATLSKKYLSWVTMMTAFFLFFSTSSSHSAISPSRWLVGSSKISKSDGVSNTLISARRFFCPPDKCPHVSLKSVIPSRVIIFLASVIRSVASSSVFPFSRSSASISVSSGRKEGCWGRKRTTMPCARMTLPSSGSSIPARILSSVLLPVPLMPMIPTFSPSCKKKEAPSKSLLSPYAFVILSAVKMFMFHPFL